MHTKSWKAPNSKTYTTTDRKAHKMLAPVCFWDSVLWSGETKLFTPMDQRYVWRRKNEAKAPVKHCVDVVMLWAWFASSGTRNPKHAEGTTDSIKYQDILGENVMLSMRKLKFGHHWTFQHGSVAYLKVHQGLVSEEVVLKYTRVTVTLARLEHHRESLVGFEEGSGNRVSKICVWWNHNNFTCLASVSVCMFYLSSSLKGSWSRQWSLLFVSSELVRPVVWTQFNLGHCVMPRTN